MNFTAWWLWVVEHQNRALYLLFLLLIISTPVGLLSGYQVFRIGVKYKLMRLVGLLLMCIGFSGVCDLIANIDPPTCQCAVKALHYPAWFAWWYWLGRFLLCVPVCLLWWHLQHPENMGPEEK